MNHEESMFWRAGLSDEPLEEEREAMSTFKHIQPRLTADEILEGRFSDNAMWMHKLREEARRRSDRERLWRKVKRWAKRLAFGLAIVGLGYLAVWASLR